MVVRDIARWLEIDMAALVRASVRVFCGNVRGSLAFDAVAIFDASAAAFRPAERGAHRLRIAGIVGRRRWQAPRHGMSQDGYRFKSQVLDGPSCKGAGLVIHRSARLITAVKLTRNPSKMRHHIPRHAIAVNATKLNQYTKGARTPSGKADDERHVVEKE